MENKRFLTAQDVMEMLGVSLSYAYKLIRRLNAELEALSLLHFWDWILVITALNILPDGTARTI